MGQDLEARQSDSMQEPTPAGAELSDEQLAQVVDGCQNNLYGGSLSDRGFVIDWSYQTTR